MTDNRRLPSFDGEARNYYKTYYNASKSLLVYQKNFLSTELRRVKNEISMLKREQLSSELNAQLWELIQEEALTKRLMEMNRQIMQGAIMISEIFKDTLAEMNCKADIAAQAEYAERAEEAKREHQRIREALEKVVTGCAVMAKLFFLSVDCLLPTQELPNESEVSSFSDDIVVVCNATADPSFIEEWSDSESSESDSDSEESELESEGFDLEEYVEYLSASPVDGAGALPPREENVSDDEVDGARALPPSSNPTFDFERYQVATAELQVMERFLNGEIDESTLNDQLLNVYSDLFPEYSSISLHLDLTHRRI